MYFERWVQRTLIHKSLGNETATANVLGEKEKKESPCLSPSPSRSLIDSEKRHRRHLDSSNAALMEDKYCTNPF